MEYSPYPYGWDYDNYSLSGNNQYLAYGKILFNALDFLDQIGSFQEQVYALNYDGSVAFGQSGIWDTTTFPIHGNATLLANMPFSTTIMSYDQYANVLYAFNSTECLEKHKYNGCHAGLVEASPTNNRIEQRDAGAQTLRQAQGDAGGISKHALSYRDREVTWFSM